MPIVTRHLDIWESLKIPFVGSGDYLSSDLTYSTTVNVDFPGSVLECRHTCLTSFWPHPRWSHESPETKGKKISLPLAFSAWFPMGTILSMPVSITVSQAPSGPHDRHLLVQFSNTLHEPLSSYHQKLWHSHFQMGPASTLHSPSKRLGACFNHQLAALDSFLSQWIPNSFSVPQVVPCQIYLQCFSVFLPMLPHPSAVNLLD